MSCTHDPMGCGYPSGECSGACLAQALRPRVPRPCMELGVCQSRRLACHGCDWHKPAAAAIAPITFAPGVIDGPYSREARPVIWAKNASTALRMVVDYLMRPYP